MNLKTNSRIFRIPVFRIPVFRLEPKVIKSMSSIFSRLNYQGHTIFYEDVKLKTPRRCVAMKKKRNCKENNSEMKVFLIFALENRQK